MSAKIERCTAQLLQYKLDKPVGGSGVSAIDVLAVDLEDADGAVGLGFSYGLRGGGRVMLESARELMSGSIEGASAAAPQALWRRMTGSLNRLGRGPAYLAMAAVDLAAWDLHAKQRAIPLGVALGGEARDVPVYASGGLRPDTPPTEAAEIALAHVETGYRGVKPRLAGSPSDAALLGALFDAVPDGIDLMGDANEKCDLTRAKWLSGLCAEHGLLWLEEPLPSYDTAAFADLARNSPTPIATGEHLQGAVEVRELFRVQGCTIIQPDLAMMGGMTECLRVSELAAHHGIAVAPHFLPSLFVHLAAAAPNLTWLEEFPLLEPLFEFDVPLADDGTMRMPDGPGHGLAWADGARKRYAVDA